MKAFSLKKVTFINGSLAFILLLMGIASCTVSFKGITIPPEVNTYFVGRFEVYPEDFPIQFAQDFAEKLRDKVRRESRLSYTDTDPDVEFRGAIAEYLVTEEAPQAGETTSFNRLTIAVQVEYVNNVKEEDTWDRPKRFPFFLDFPADQNLIDVQDDLVDQIYDQLVEDIFNKTFTNW